MYHAREDVRGGGTPASKEKGDGPSCGPSPSGGPARPLRAGVLEGVQLSTSRPLAATYFVEEAEAVHAVEGNDRDDALDVNAKPVAGALGVDYDGASVKAPA
jgi:hypothetical protein